MENLPFAVEELIQAGYNRDHLLALLEGTDRLIQNADIYQTPAGIDALGTLQLDDIELPVLEKSVQNAERKQRNHWENVATWLIQQNRPAALCVFHDDVGRFRLALVTLRYQGILQPQAEDYRRLSLLVKPGRPNKTFVQRLCPILKAATLDQLREAFSVDAVSRHFYEEYLKVFQKDLLNGVRPGNTPVEQKQNFALIFTARVLFVSFVAKKGWLGDQEERFLPWLFQRYTQAQQALHSETEFYDRWLCPLFFEAFRNSPQAKQALNLFADLPDDVRGIYQEAPYLNGELFRRQQDLDGLSLTDEAVQKFFDFLYSYNFLVEENTNYDADLELSPEFLGLLLEQLINSVGVGREVGEVGAHYTPRTEVELMCRLALVEALAAHNVLTREKAARFVFEGIFEGNREQARRVWEALENLKVLDPAVGSGAFLVGMLQVLEELFDRLRRPLGQLLDLVELRKKILSRVLHGVDVLRWAVWMTELRLWLTLLVDLHDEVRNSLEPILPSLGLRVLQGDTLVQRLGDHLIPARLPAGDPFWQHPQVRRYLHNLNQARQNYFDNQIGIEEVHQHEQELFDHLIEVQIQIIQQQNLQQGEIFGNENAGPVNDVDARLEELEAMRDALREGRRPFVWWIDFSDVMIDRGGFDIVIGNPPYVRQELIRDLLGGLPADQYKNLLQQSYLMDWREVAAPGQPPQPDGRADLYVYFYARTLRLLNDSGVHVFIVSNAWMDVAYGRWLQEIFLRYAPLRLVINNRVRRSFVADVNTVITVALAPRREHNESTRFCTLRKPFEELEANEKTCMVLAEQDARGNYFRILVQSRAALYQAGVVNGKYIGGKWGGLYHRAPDIFFTILQKGQNQLVRLGDIAEVRRGFTTGANEFFYLEPVGMTVKEAAELREKDPKAPVRVRNGAGWEGEIEAAWLRPVIKSPQEIKTLRVRLEDLRYLVFMPPEDVREAIAQGNEEPWCGYPLAAAYICWGRCQGYHRRRTCASRRQWWDLGSHINDSIGFPERHQKRFFVIFNPDHCMLNKSFYGVSGDEILAALLMSHTAHLFAEILGRTPGGGGGPLDIDVNMASNIAIIRPQILTDEQKQILHNAINQIGHRKIKTIFEELGFSLCNQNACNNPEHPYEHVNPETITLDQVQQASPDRFELDQVVFDVLGLTDEERLEVYKAVAELVKERLLLARNAPAN